MRGEKKTPWRGCAGAVTGQGVQISTKSYEAGLAALRERDVRRKGLGVALIAVLVTIGRLYLKIRQMESQSET